MGKPLAGLQVGPDLDQLAYGLNVGIYEIVGPARWILDGICPRINSKAVVKRGKDLLELYGAIDNVAAMFVRPSNHLSVAHASSGKQCEGSARPVVSAIHLVDFGCPAEFSPYDDGNILVQSSLT